MLNIEFSNQQDRAVETEQLAKIAESILADHGISGGELSIALVDDPGIRSVNKEYLNHDWETDVISFVLEKDADSIVAQLIVSTDTAYRVAKEVDTTPEVEMALYVAHGTLHLVGYDDLNDEDAAVMRLAEQKYLKQFSIEYSGREQ